MKLRIGLVGAGLIATEKHVPAWQSLKSVDVAAICDLNESAAKHSALRFGIKNFYADVEEMLRKEKLDIVDITTPPATHASLGILAMDAGCHVLVEKPMATSVQEADRMIDAANKNGVKLCVVHQNLCNPAVVKAKRLVKEGVVGDLLNVEVQTFELKDGYLCTNENHWCHTLVGGIFGEILPHPIYLLTSFLKGATPVYVSSRKLGLFKWIEKDELRVLVEAENGMGSILASCNSLMQRDTLDIIGTRKTLSVDLWGRTVIVHKPHRESSLSVGMSNLYLSSQLFKIIGGTALTFMKTVRGRIRASAHYSFISKFANSIINGTEPPTTPQDGRDNVKVLETICKKIK